LGIHGILLCFAINFVSKSILHKKEFVKGGQSEGVAEMPFFAETWGLDDTGESGSDEVERPEGHPADRSYENPETFAPCF